MAGSVLADDAKTVAAGLEKWREVRQVCGGNYRYRVVFSSAFGFGSMTRVTVENHKVVGRDYQVMTGRPVELAPVELAPVGNEGSEDPGGWEETAEEIGSHKEGAVAKTLDELYADATEIASRKLKAYERRYVKLNKQGLLISCFIVDTRIMDDAPFDGINLAEIQVEENVVGSAAATVDPGAERNLKHYPESVDGLVRHVILLPHKDRGEDQGYRVELIVGKKMMTDGVNKVRLSGQIEKQTLKGFGFSFYTVSKIGGAMSTRIGVPSGKPQVETFVEIPRTLIAYNSRLPIVVYVPADDVVKYRIFGAGDESIAEQR